MPRHRFLLEQLEEAPHDPRAPLAFLAGASFEIGQEELRAARRRSLLLLAAGGDPRRELEIDERPVRSLAADLDSPARRDALTRSLEALVREAQGLERVSAAAAELLAEPEAAWCWFALALLAEGLAEE